MWLRPQEAAGRRLPVPEAKRRPAGPEAKRRPVERRSISTRLLLLESLDDQRLFVASSLASWKARVALLRQRFPGSYLSRDHGAADEPSRAGDHAGEYRFRHQNEWSDVQSDGSPDITMPLATHARRSGRPG